jgi:hypothetical protein
MNLWWQFLVLVLIFIVLNAAGILLAGIGLVLTLPLTFLVLYVLFEDLTREVFSEEEELPTTHA